MDNDSQPIISSNHSASHQDDGGDYVYDYFTFNMDELVYGADGMLYMPDKLPGQRDSDFEDGDSQDSNREDHENHDYPEERSSFDGEEEPHTFIENNGGSLSEEEQVESAVERYNKKEEKTKPLKNKLLE